MRFPKKKIVNRVLNHPSGGTPIKCCNNAKMLLRVEILGVSCAP